MVGNIRSMLSYYRSMSDHSLTRDCFDNGARESDIDGVVGINGHVLFSDQKSAEATPNGGQRRLHQEILNPKSVSFHIRIVDIEEDGKGPCPLCSGKGCIPTYATTLKQVFDVRSRLVIANSLDEYKPWLKEFCRKSRMGDAA